MGMYTEVVFRATINRSKMNTDDFAILSYLFNPSDDKRREDLTLPEHEFFKCQRWFSIGRSSSFHHHPNVIKDWYQPSHQNTEADNVYIFSRSDLKDYDGEIDLFFDWIDTLGLFYKDEFMGYSLYEEDDTPTIFNATKDSK
jgi:hypothetical protein